MTCPDSLTYNCSCWLLHLTAKQNSGHVKMFMAVWEKPKSSGFFGRPIGGQTNQSVALIGQTPLKRLKCFPTGPARLVPALPATVQLGYLSVGRVMAARRTKAPWMFFVPFVSPEPSVLLLYCLCFCFVFCKTF